MAGRDPDAQHKERPCGGARRREGEKRHSCSHSRDCAADDILQDYVAGMDSSTSLHPPVGLPEINADLQEVAREVHQEFAEQLDPREVDECLARVAATFDDASVRSFVPLLVRRYVNDELHDRLEHP